MAPMRLAMIVLGALGVALASAAIVHFAPGQRTASAPPAATAPTPANPVVPNPAPANPKTPGPGTSVATAPPPTAMPQPIPASPSAPAAAVLREVVPPAFDVVRVEPDGEAVIAGRAPAGAMVELLRNGEVYDRIVADASGLFAVTPKALAPGSHELSLRFTAPDGKSSAAPQSVTVVVAADRKTRPMVALTAPGQPTVVLSKPDSAPVIVAAAPPSPARSPAPSAAPAPAPLAAVPAPGAPAVTPARQAVAIDSVESEEAGKLFVSGHGTPGATLRLYLNDSYLASGPADAGGKVTFTINGGIKPGDYRVRLDDAEPATGAVKGRAEVIFAAPPAGGARPPAQPAAQVAANAASSGPVPAIGAARPSGGAVSTPMPAPAPATQNAPSVASPTAAPPPASMASSPSAVVVPEIRTMVVASGDNLWTISRRTYGQGIRYTVIYGANDKQIRDPDLIYPGQIFVLPQEGN